MNVAIARLGRGVNPVVPLTTTIRTVYPFQVLLHGVDTGLPRVSETSLMCHIEAHQYATMWHMDYLPRVMDAELVATLAYSGAVLLDGPKQCGKTTTARQQAASEVLLDTSIAARITADQDLTALLKGRPPRLVDEWQLFPDIWSAVRREVDERQIPGQFILTGSARPTDSITRHTGVGRIRRLTMRPMSLFETGQSNGAISLARLVAKQELPESPPTTELTLTGIVEVLTRGGWPALRNLPMAAATNSVRAYLAEIVRIDIPMATGIEHDPERLLRLTRALARNTASPIADTTLARDVGGDLERRTVARYLDALQRVMVTEDCRAWEPSLRSATTLRIAPKRHFIDPSLAVAALRAGPGQLEQDRPLLGLLFESLVIRDLRVYAQPLDAIVHHYRDAANREADAVIPTPDGPVLLCEIKLLQGDTAKQTRTLNQAAAKLTKIAQQLDPTVHPDVTLAIVISSGIAHRRGDGVWVLPITALGP